LEPHDSLFRGPEAKISKTSDSLNHGGLQINEFWPRHNPGAPSTRIPGAPRPMKMGNIFSQLRYEAIA
jgi:hypothetical protein